MKPTKSIARNAVWNVAGQVAPILIAVLSVPWLIRQLGIERFGFLSLAWVVIGYAGLFDFGLGRALTRVVAGHLGAGQREQAKIAGRTGTLVLMIVGLVVGALLMVAAEALTMKVLKIPAALQAEALLSLRLLALSMPIVLLTTALRGVLEAEQEFQRLNVIRIAMGLLNYLGPLAVSVVWPRLEAVVLAVIGMRIVGLWLHLRACKATLGAMLVLHPLDRAVLGGLFALGGWMSVSNVVAPLLTYLDRLVVAQILTIEQVAYYSTPYDVITRTLVLPYALMAVIFPTLANRSIPRQDLAEAYSASVRMLWVLMWPICFTAMILAHEILELWLGSTFAALGAPVLQILAMGVFVNSLAQAPANLIQASGSPKWMALLHLLELPVFIWVLWVAVERYGIIGAAAAWSGRAAIDAAMLYKLAGSKMLRQGMPVRWWVGATAFCTTATTLGFAVQGHTIVFWVWLIGLLSFGAYAWYAMLNLEDRQWLLKLVGSRLRSAP